MAHGGDYDGTAVVPAVVNNLTTWEADQRTADRCNNSTGSTDMKGNGNPACRAAAGNPTFPGWSREMSHACRQWQDNNTTANSPIGGEACGERR